MKSQYSRFPRKNTENPDVERTVVPEKMVSGGYVLVREGRGVTLLRGALPGEKVIIRTLGRRRGVEFAETVVVTERSPNRTEPRCPLFGECGGCEWQHISYDAQVGFKRDILLENLRRLAGLEEQLIPAISIHPSKPWAYRSRIQLHRADGVTGFHRRGTHTVIPVKYCPVADDGVNAYLGSTDRPPADGRFVVVSDEEKGWRVEGSARRASAMVKGRRWLFDPGSFFQANLPMVDEVVDVLRSRIGNRTIVDLYAGSGLLGLARKRNGDTLIAVEPDRRNSSLISKNAGNAEGSPEEVIAITSSAEAYLDTSGSVATDWPDWTDTTVVVDPPRSGLSCTVRKRLKELKPAKIVYLGCDPAALARDVGDLCDCYGLESIDLFDFFPQTSHLETLVELTCV